MMDENTIAHTAVLCKTLHENTNEFLIFSSSFVCGVYRWELINVSRCLPWTEVPKYFWRLILGFRVYMWC